MKMSPVFECEFSECTYNQGEKCRTLAITIGDGQCACCDTSFRSETKAGVAEVEGGVGACRKDDCVYNQSLECTAQGIQVQRHEDHAECDTFRAT